MIPGEDPRCNVRKMEKKVGCVRRTEERPGAHPAVGQRARGNAEQQHHKQESVQLELTREKMLVVLKGGGKGDTEHPGAERPGTCVDVHRSQPRTVQQL